MIRDPSDGTVREPPKANLQGKLTGSVVEDSLTTPDTGLRQPTRTDAQERMEKSRQWLKDYQSKQEQQNARGNSSGEELQAAGHSVEGQRETKSGTPPLGADRRALG